MNSINLSIRNKLRIANIGQLIVVCSIVFTILKVSMVIHTVTRERVINLELNNGIRKIGFDINDFFFKKAKIDVIIDEYQSLKKANPSDKFLVNLDSVINQLKVVSKMYEENESIEKNVMDLTDESVKPSEAYIEDVSKRLADPSRQGKVSKLERLVIIGASTNNIASYSIKVLFKNLKEDISKKAELQAYLETLITNTEKDEKMLAGTPYVELPRKNKAVNIRIKELVLIYVSNNDKVILIEKEVDSSVSNLINQINQNEIQYSSEQMGEIRSSILLVIVIALIISLIVIVLNVTLSQNIQSFIADMIQSFHFMSEGKMNSQVHEKYLNQTDEIGNLTKALDKFNRKLKDIISEIIESSKQVATAAMQFSSSSQLLSQGATEQASSVEEVSSSMEQIVSNIQENTNNAKQTETISNNSAQVVERVDKTSHESLKAVKEIAQKITIINDIAFQTNILALNAAVEAARAGQYGRGFAVVAAEVRKLAERSKIAADEIDRLSISSLNITDETGKIMEQLFPEILKTSKLVQEIASSSMEQSLGVEQINSAIQQLNEVTQQNAATAEQMATGAEELFSQAEQLKELISFFTFDNHVSTLNHDNIHHSSTEPSRDKFRNKY